ncbi:MAG TPA: hypothetical protein VFQ65_01175 [Kofleriaceae bacterium]|nr:hypothetical protein [Kofleriaceae bacterium]
MARIGFGGALVATTLAKGSTPEQVLAAIRVAVAWRGGERFGFEVAVAWAIVAAGIDRKLRA